MAKMGGWQIGFRKGGFQEKGLVKGKRDVTMSKIFNLLIFKLKITSN